MSLSRLLPWGLTLALLGACGDGEAPSSQSSTPPTSDAPLSSGAASESPLDAPPRVDVLSAERQRSSESLPTTVRDAGERLAVVRALSRIGDAGAIEKLREFLKAPEPEIVRWAAYGLGFSCSDGAVVSALAARAMSVPPEAAWDPAFEAIVRAIAHCPNDGREALLSDWLEMPGERGRAVALALGDLAAKSKHLRDETWAKLAQRALGGALEPPDPTFLYPASRVEHLPKNVSERVAEVARTLLETKSPLRYLALRALGRTRPHGLPAIESVFAKGAEFSMVERVEAARALGRFEGLGQEATAQAILAQDERSHCSAEAASVAMALLTSKLPRPTEPALEKKLSALATLKPCEEAGPRKLRLASLVRCAAAQHLAHKSLREPILSACDLEGGVSGELAKVEWARNHELSRTDVADLTAFIASGRPLVREEALRVAASHAEFGDVAPLLPDLLSAKPPGVVTTTLELLAESPRLASSTPRKKVDPKKLDPKKDKPDVTLMAPPSKALLDAVRAAHERSVLHQDPEMELSALSAIGALGDKALLPEVERSCGSWQGTIRARAEKSLALLGIKKACATGAVAPAATEELPAENELVFESDAGALTVVLDPVVAPMATARIVSLAKRGYYDGNILHRVDPSFVVQWGSPFGDGYGGPDDLPPVRCETSPKPFDRLDVGLALSGRDTGSSQLFVMRARHPHLDGGYPHLGFAEGPWDEVLAGDTITKVTVRVRPTSVDRVP